MQGKNGSKIIRVEVRTKKRRQNEMLHRLFSAFMLMCTETSAMGINRM